MCTNESTGLFQAFLNEMAKKSVYVDVPKVKRDNAISTLIFTKHALKNKDEIAAFYSLSNLCYKFNEIYHDEYQLNTLEIDMVAFSTGIMSLLIKHYQQAEFIILMLIRKYHNPVFIYICGLIHQYQFKFDQALTIMQEALELLSGHKNKNFFWPGTDILIVSSDVSLMKATIMRSIEEMMTLKEIPCEPGIPIFHVDVHLANEIHNKFNTKSKQGSSQSLSNLIKYDVYNLIRAYVDDLIQFDARNHFIDYKILVANMSRNVSHSSNQLDKKSLPPETSAKAKSKGISMKHQSIQTKFPMKNVQTQAGSKTISHSTQTIQMDVVDHKKELEQLQGKLDMALAQQKLAEANVATLEAKVEQLNNTLKDANMEVKQLKKDIPYLQWDNNCLKKVQQEIIEASTKKDTLYKELLLKEIQQNCEMRLHINKQFETKCHNIIATLRSIRHDLSDTTVPTIDECNKHLDDWERHLQSCLTEEEKLMNRHREVLKLVSDDLLQLISLDSVPVVHRETTNLLHEYFPILAVSLIECQNKLREKEKQETSAIGKGTRDTSPNLNPSTSTAGISSQEERNKKNKAPSISNATSNRSVTGFASDDVIKNDSKKKMQSLCSYLKNKIPHKTEAEIMAALQSFRKQNNGKLSGMTVHYILFNVYKILDSRQSAWAAVESKFKSGWEGSEDMTCSICLDLFHGFPTMTLKCKHKFHAKCIRPWLSKNSICAICRVYVTLDEDFPPLH